VPTATPQYGAPKWTVTGSANSAQLGQGQGRETETETETQKMLQLAACLIKCDQRHRITHTFTLSHSRIYIRIRFNQRQL